MFSPPAFKKGLICALYLLVTMLSTQGFGESEYSESEYSREHSASPVFFDDSQSLVTLEFQIEHIVENDNSYTIDQLIRFPTSVRWLTSKRATPNFGYTKHPHWFRLRLVNTSQKPLERLLVINNPLLEDANLYQVVAGQIVSQQNIGFSLPFSDRQVEHRNLVFPLKFAPNESSEIFIHTKTELPLQLPMELWKERDFWEKDAQIMMFLCMVFGVMMIMIGYNLFVALVTRETVYFSYVLFISSVLFFSFTQRGLSAQYLWPNHPEWNFPSITLFISLCTLTCSLFSMQFLHLQQNMPNAYRILRLLVIISGVMGILVFVIEPKLLIAVATALPTMMAITILYSGITNWPNADMDGRIFTIAWVSLLSGVVLLSLNKLGLMPVNMVTEYSLQAGSAIEAVLLSVALAVRINLLKKKAFDAQRRELDAKSREMSALREAVKAKDESRAKANFLAVMSHEIRTPMNGVLGLAEVLKATPLNSQQQSLLKNIQKSGNTLLKLLNEILDFSKLETRNIRLENENFDPIEVITHSIGILEFSNHKPEVKIQLFIDNNLPKQLIGDPHRLQQILFNLVGNALKFTDQGTVSVHAKLGCATEDDVLLEFHVEDTGIGMPADQVEDLFKPFQQADFSTTRKYGGSGLGLAITKELVSIMDGKIGVDSEEGKGSTFWFTLKFKPQPEDATFENSDSLPATSADTETSDKPKELVKTHVLIAEDNPVNVTVVTSFLDQLNVSYSLASNGKAAVDAFKAEHNSIDLILMDCEMPILDGYKATEQIRQFENELGLTPTPIVAVTAHAIPEYLDHCEQSGMNKTLIKPLKPEQMKSVLETYRSKPSNNQRKQQN